jgi:biopolymer transport protein ExbB
MISSTSSSIFRPARMMIVMVVCAAAFSSIAGNLLAQPKSAPAKAAAPAAEEAPASAADMTMLELFAKGGFFMWPILACSLVAVTVIIERFISLRRRAVIPPDFLDQVRRVYRDPATDREKALEFCRSQNTSIARILAAAIGKLHRGPAAVEKTIEEAGANEVSRLRRNFRTISTVASIAPLLGLIGTISGMIKAFQVTSDIGTGSGKALATGIYEALVTTYAGLLVAIPTLAFYHYLQGRVERLVSEMNEVCTAFIEHYVDTPHTIDVAAPATESRELEPVR